MEKITSINIKSIVAKVNEIIEAIALMPDKYDDTKLRNDMSEKIESRLNEASRKHDELARAQNAIVKEIKAIEIPKPQNLEPLLKRIKALEDKPEIKPVVVDNSDIERKIMEIEKSIESLDRRLDFVRRTYSEKWESMQFDRSSCNKGFDERMASFESDIASLKKSLSEILE